MSDESPQDFIPAPGGIHDLAERAVEFVRRAVVGPKGGMLLDYRPETLPLLDHYLGSVPHDQPETVALIAAAAGAYFGEVVRRVLGGAWEQTDEPAFAWALVAPGGLRFVPGTLATEAILRSDAGVPEYEVPVAARAAVEEALADKEVPEDEYYTLSGRLEALFLISDVVAASTLAAAARPPSRELDDSDPAGDG